MKKFFRLGLIMMGAMAFVARGQQFPLSNHYLMNPYSLGPQFAGARSSGEFFFNYRKDWVNIQPSPETMRFNSNFSVGGGLYLGAETFLDRVDILERFRGSLSLTYKLQLANDQYLSAGINGQMYQNSVNLSLLQGDLNDPLFQNLDQLSKLNFNAGWGIMYANPYFEAGIGMPVLLRTPDAYIFQSQGNFAFEREFLLHIAGKMPLADNTYLKPMLLLRHITNQPTALDGALQIEFSDQVWVGAVYRNSQALAFVAGARLLNTMLLNYSYETGIGGYHFRSGGTHEITIGFRFTEKVADRGSLKRTRGGPSQRSKKSPANKRYMLHEYQQMYEQKYRRDQ